MFEGSTALVFGEYVVERGGGPILYAYKDTMQAKAVNAMVHEAVNEPSSPIWDVAPFVDLPGTYYNLQDRTQYLVRLKG